MMFSSEAVARKCLSEHNWRRLGKTIAVLNDCRDLGAHLNATKRWRSATLTKRMLQTPRETIG